MKSAVVLLLITATIATPTTKFPQATPSRLNKVSIGKQNLITRSDNTVNIARIFSSLNHTLMKWGARPLPYYPPVAEEQAALASARRIATRQEYELLSDDVDEWYYGPTIIGAGDGHPQAFDMVFDTASSDIWLFGPECDEYQGCANPYPNTENSYDEGGIPLGTTTSLTYDWGYVNGDNYLDDISIAGLNSTNQTLVSVTSAYDAQQFDAMGFVGLGLSSSVNDNGTSFFENLIAQGTITTAEFGIYLGRDSSGTVNNSEITFGGRDSTKYSGSFTTIPVTSEAYWQVTLDAVTVDGLLGGVNTLGQAVFDSSAIFITVPTVAAQEIMSKIPGSVGFLDGDTVIYFYPCSTPDDLIPALEFAGHSFQIDPEDFNLGPVPCSDYEDLALGNQTQVEYLSSIIPTCDLPPLCFAGISGSNLTDTDDVWVIGSTFLKSWYTVMSYDGNNGSPAVLLAPSINQES